MNTDINVYKYKKAMIASAFSIPIFVAISMLFLKLFPGNRKIVENVVLALSLLLMAICLTSVILLAKRMQEFQQTSVLNHLNILRDKFGYGIQYVFKEIIPFHEVLDDPSVMPWLSDGCHREHIIKGNYRDFNFTASNLFTYRRFEHEHHTDNNYEGYYITIEEKRLVEKLYGAKMHIRTNNYSRVPLSGQGYRGPIKYGKWQYELINCYDNEFNAYCTATSDSPQNITHIINANSELRRIMVQFAQASGQNFGVFISDDGRVSLAVPDFKAFSFGFEKNDAENSGRIIRQYADEIEKYLDFLVNITMALLQ